MRQKWNAFDIFNYTLMAFLLLITLFPFWHIFVITISTQEAFFKDRYHVIPSTFVLSNYFNILSNPNIYRGFINSAVVTVGGTALNLLLTSMAAFALSKSYLRGGGFIFKMIILTMFFSGGLIPSYVLLSKLGLKDSLLVLVLPTAINSFNIILMRNYFTSTIPSELEDSARIDGCNDLQILFRIIAPVSKPIIATIALFVSVGQWNDWFMPMLYLTDINKYTLAIVLRNMIVSSDQSFIRGLQQQTPEIFKATAIVVTILPIIIVYPFIQKHFVQGIMLGSVKE